MAADDLRHGNTAALLAGFCNPTLQRIPAQMAALRARLDAPALRQLLEIVVLRAGKRHNGLSGWIWARDDMAEVDRLHESGELEDYFAARRQAYQKRYRPWGVARGIERGLEQGIQLGLSEGRVLLLRLAARKIGESTAARLAGLLADIGDAEGLARAGDLMIDCATGEELITRLGNG